MWDRLPFVREHPYTAIPALWGIIAVIGWWFFWSWQAALLWWIFVVGTTSLFRWWEDRNRAEQQDAEFRRHHPTAD